MSNRCIYYNQHSNGIESTKWSVKTFSKFTKQSEAISTSNNNCKPQNISLKSCKWPVVVHERTFQFNIQRNL